MGTPTFGDVFGGGSTFDDYALQVATKLEPATSRALESIIELLEDPDDTDKVSTVLSHYAFAAIRTALVELPKGWRRP